MEAVDKFRVLKFAADAESGDPVGVALLVGQESPKLVFDRKFPRLSCLAPDMNPALLEDYLEALRPHLSRSTLDEVEAEIARLSPQLSLTTTKDLFARPTNATLRLLKSKYLGRETRKASRGKRSQVNGAIEEYLRQRYQVPESLLLKKAKAHDFLSHDLLPRLGEDELSIARVINAPHHLVLLDGLKLSEPGKTMNDRALKVGSAFHRLRELREPLQEHGRELFIASVLVEHPERLDSRQDYAIKLLGHESDVVVRDTETSLKLASAIERAVADAA
ncbi:MAG: hypothetical protein AAF735_08445 [Myxococcota bacterium]